MVSYYLGAFGVFYGLTLGLIAVASWQNFTDLDRLVAEEAAALRVLDRSAGWYPPPCGACCAGASWSTPGSSSTRSGRRGGGKGLEAAQARLTAIEEPLVAFEPATAGQQAAHAEALRAYARYLELRRQRAFGATSTGLPAVVWYVLLAGAAASIALTFLFVLPDARGHLVLTTVLAGFLGLLIFLVAAMDLPYRGEVSVGPEAFEAVRQQMLAGVGGAP